MDKKWYQNNFVIIALLILFFPAGLFLMWKYSEWKKPVKWVITGVFVLLLISGIFNQDTTQSSQSNTSSPEQVSTQTPISEPTHTPKPVEKMKIEVTSQIVKKVDGKYRYFFDVRNNDVKDFQGSVTINLFNDKQKTALGRETFTTNRPIEPNLGNSVNFDINSGPINQHGEYGITKYSYTVEVNGTEVNSGEGTITDKFEDLDF